MPLTRSKGKAGETWMVDLGDGSSSTVPAVPRRTPPPTPIVDSAEPPSSESPREAPLSAPPSILPSDQKKKRSEEDNSARVLQPLNQTFCRATSDRTVGSIKSQKTNKSHSKTLKARREYLKIREEQFKMKEEQLKLKAELVEIDLQIAEEEESEYDEEGLSNEEYVRSWIEEAPDCISQPDEDLATAGEFESQQNDAIPPPRPVDIKAQKEQQLKLISTENKLPIKQEDSKCQFKKEHNDSVDALRPFISELTSAIAGLAVSKNEAIAPPHPSVSKVIMTLPNFNGSHTEWLSFKAIYETTRAYFNDIENTARLRRSLQGRALEAVSSELIGHARPDDIMAELELQFGRPDAIAQAEIDRLRALPRCSESPKDICTFASRVRNSVVTLRALKRDHYLINAELLRCLTDKLPNSLRVQWYKEFTVDYQSMPDLGHFSKFITEHARYCSAFALPETVTETVRRSAHKIHTATKEPSTRCKICDTTGHYALDCENFRQANSERRWELAKEYSLCFRCLQSRYQGHTCKPKKCSINNCTASHHRLLHFDKKNRVIETQQKPEEAVVSSCTFREHQAFLKIVPITVSGPVGEVPTFALLDDGSTISLIDEDIARQVGARGEIDPLRVQAIGNTSLDLPDSRKVTVALANRNSKRVSFAARTVPHLNLSPQTVSEDDIAECEHLMNIKDKLTYDTAMPKVLIGQDNCHLLLADKLRRGPPDQPIASLTALGWVIHGTRAKASPQKVNVISRVTTIEHSFKSHNQKQACASSIVIAKNVTSDNSCNSVDNHLVNRGPAKNRKPTSRKRSGRKRTRRQNSFAAARQIRSRDTPPDTNMLPIVASPAGAIKSRTPQSRGHVGPHRRQPKYSATCDNSGWNGQSCTDCHVHNSGRHRQSFSDYREHHYELPNRWERDPGANFEMGDLVPNGDTQLSRNTWPRGRVIATYPGTDGHVRTVEVRTAGGILKRPAKKLVPLPK